MKNLQEQIRKVLRETLESKWNKGNYDYQYGYCHYFAYNVIGKIRKMFPKKKVNYYLLLAQEIDKEDGTIVQDYLVHAYIKIDNMLLDSNGITTMDEAWKRLEEWEERQRYLVPDEYRTEIFDEEDREWLKISVGTDLDDSIKGFQHQWSLWANSGEQSRLAKMKNIYALNALARTRKLKIINIDSFWPITNVKWGADMYWPVADTFHNWSMDRDFARTPWGHYFEDAHRAFAEHVVRAIGDYDLD